MKKISIIVPVYNVQDYLERCLETISNQTYSNIEIIIVNDGSTDDSLKICKKYAKKDKRIILIDKKNEGVAKARNIGLKKASGDYIGFVDSDDFIELDMYEFLCKKMEENDLDIAICSSYNVYENSKKHEKTEGIDKIMTNVESLELLLSYGYYGSGIWDKLFKKEIIKDNEFSENRSNGEELCFLYKSLFQSKKVGYTSIPKYNYVQREDSVTHLVSVNLGLVESYEELKKFIYDKSELIHLREKVITKLVMAALKQYNNCLILKETKSDNYEYLKNIIENSKKNIDYTSLSIAKKIQLCTIFYAKPLYDFAFRHVKRLIK